MKFLKAKLVVKLIEFFEKDFRRIEHDLSVLYESEKIVENREAFDRDIVISCALLHDVGIKISEEKFGYNNGKTQEEFGPPIAENILYEIGLESEKIVKVKQIIANHHSPSRYDYIELEILKEADRIINTKEKNNA